MPVTTNRITTVTIDDHSYGTITHTTNGSLSMGQIAADGLYESGNVEHIDGVGLQLTAIQRLQSFKHETSAADKGVFRPGSTGVKTGGVFATSMLAAPMYRADTDLSGIVLGSRRDNGDIFHQKQVAAGASFANELADDVEAFGYPDAGADLVPCDRVFVSDDNHEPNDGISMIFSMPDSSGVSALSTIARLYFSGIPGATVALPPNGTGQYCLVLSGDGRATLKEKLDDSNWTWRKYFRWCDSNQIAGGTHTVKIHSDAYQDEDGHWHGSVLSFQFATFDQGLVQHAITFVNLILGLNWTSYSIPKTKEIAPQLNRLRFDLRRNVKASVQFNKHLFRDSGSFKTVRFQLAQPAIGTSPNPIVVRWFGSMPKGVETDTLSYMGSEIDIALYGADGTACTPVAPISNTLTRGERQFEAIPGQATYYAEVTMKPDGSKTKSPIVNRIDYGQAGTVGKPTLTPTELPKITAVTISGQDADPGHESIGVVCEDVYDTIPQLGFRSGMPIRVEVDLGSGVKSCLGNGYVAAATGRRRRTKMTQGRQGATVSAKWRTWTIKAQGEHAKLSRMQAPFRIDLMRGSDLYGNSAPYKVTDVIKILFSYSGYAPHQIDVPDLPILYLNDGRLPLFVESFTELYPLIVMMIRDYLGGYLVWDPNSSKTSEVAGCWRVKIPPRPNDAGPYLYNYLAHFRLDLNLTKNGTFDTLANGQVVKRVGVNRDGYFEEVEKPEANQVTVYGVGFPDTGGILSKSAGVRIQIPPLNNWVSAEFGQSSESPALKPVPDPSSPDYLGYILPVFYSDPGINSVPLAQLVQYRLYDMMCHAKKKFRFEAPLVLVTDSTDPYQRQPRKLMYGDPVLLDGGTFFVESCHVDYHGRSGGDTKQMAAYELFSVPALHDYAAVITSRTD